MSDIEKRQGLIDERIIKIERRHAVLENDLKNYHRENREAHEAIKEKAEGIEDILHETKSDLKVYLDRGEYRRKIWKWMVAMSATIAGVWFGYKNK